MRSRVVAAVVVATGLGVAQPSAAQTIDGCADAAACGQPECYFFFEPAVHVRPDRTRRSWIHCIRARGARLTSAPAHVDISNIEANAGGVYFDARPRDGAPRSDSAVFEVDGPSAPIHVRVGIETIPLSENTPPVCPEGGGDSQTRRSNGVDPATVTFLITCVDYEDDAYVIEGGGPGEHLDAPKHVTPDNRYLEWRYRTATASGTETTAVWATDELGARSEDKKLQVTLDPNLDEPADCWSSGGMGNVIGARPGTPRRFGVYCIDIDGDPVFPRVSIPPQRGALAAVPGTLRPADPGFGSLDATYTPSNSTTEADYFAVTPGGPRGDGPMLVLTIQPRPAPENGGGGCASSWTPVYKNTPALLDIGCNDDEGDPLSARIVTQPQHGKAHEPSATPSEYGETKFPVIYAPDSGYAGPDWMRVEVTDPYGFRVVVELNIGIEDGPPPEGYISPISPPMPAAPVLPGPTSGRQAARKVLGTTAVKRLRKDGGVEVWARSKLSRRDLLRSGRAPAIVAFCVERCRLKSDAALASGTRLLRTTRRTISAVKTPGQAHVVTLELNRRGRAALRRARKPAGRFTLSMRAGKARTKALRRSIPIGR